MKIKDIERTANVAWSPYDRYPIVLAAGTAAQQLDASFSTDAVLELYSLNLSEPDLDAQLLSSVPVKQRFQKLIWGPYGKDHVDGTIVAGCDGGIIEIYDASKLLKNESEPVARQSNHKGAVRALDFNPFQHNLLATGAGESEIYIWDLNNTHAPMTPGAKSQPFEDVTCVAWNRQVQHILACTFSAKCVVWDLRKNDPVIKLTDTVSRIRWKTIAWHPEVATQLCLASEEDEAPVIQLWDLRFATSPLKTLENHRRGVLSIAWCCQDSNLLASCGKDNRIIFWNPNSNVPGGEVFSDISKSNQWNWNFDVVWCPKNPALIASPSFDGHISIYSVMGGRTQQFQTTNKIADSFPGMDGYIEAPVPQQSAVSVSADLSKAPKWLKRPVGCTFGFGGQLIMFCDEIEPTLQTAAQQDQAASSIKGRKVIISRVITEPELIERSLQLEKALECGNFSEYCRNKAHELTDQHERNIWYFLKANFEADPRNEMLNLLGYKVEEIGNELNSLTAKEDGDNSERHFSNLTEPRKYEDSLNHKTPLFEDLQRSFKIKTSNDIEGHLTRALLLGNVEAAVKLCIKAERYADAIIIAMTGGEELLTWTRREYLRRSSDYSISSLISALICDDWNHLINNCDIFNWKEALVAVLTHSNNQDLPNLCESLGNRLRAEGHSNPKLLLDAQLCYICAGSFDRLVNLWSGSFQKSSKELQDLVELVTFLQKAIERQGRSVEISGSLADLLSHYASILADQGSLATALTYLGSSQNERVSTLRERLSISLGRQQSMGGRARQQSQSIYNPRHSFSGAGSRSSPVPSQGSAFYNPSGGLTTAPLVSTSWQQQQQPISYNNPSTLPPKTFSPPPPLQLARPPSVGLAHSGIPSRAKYIVDPSVQSGGISASSKNIAYGTVQPLVQHPQIQSANATYMHNNNMIPLMPVQSHQSSFQNPLPNVPVEKAEAAATPFSTPFPVAPPGWNDPPILTRSARIQQPKQDYRTPEPITHPLHGTVPVQNIPLSTDLPSDHSSMLHRQFSPAPNRYVPNETVPPAIINNNSQILQPNVSNFSSEQKSSFNQNPMEGNFRQMPPIRHTAHQQFAVEEKPQPIQKAPLPEEYSRIQNTLEELRNLCICAANNPQTKRKLEEVSRKLELLYDALREEKLAANTLTSLQGLVELLRTGDYPGCLALHTQLVSGPDFSQIASFMPGLKVLIQCALQLQVYLR